MALFTALPLEIASGLRNSRILQIIVTNLNFPRTNFVANRFLIILLYIVKSLELLKLKKSVFFIYFLRRVSTTFKL